MINIAICDDDSLFAAELEEKLLAYGREKLLEMDVDAFSGGPQLLDAVGNEMQYDLVFMDVRMEPQNGIDTVHELGRKNPETLIIYISSYDTQVSEMFETEPFRFLKKPLDEKIFYRYMDQAIERITQTVNYFSYVYKHKSTRITVRDILFFESHMRKVRVHRRNGEDIFYGKLNQIEEELKSGAIPFLRIHQSYLVNFYAIIRFYPDRVEISDGTILSISEGRRREVKVQMHALMRML